MDQFWTRVRKLIYIYNSCENWLESLAKYTGWETIKLGPQKEKWNMRIGQKYQTQCRPASFIRILRPRSITEMLIKVNIYFQILKGEEELEGWIRKQNKTKTGKKKENPDIIVSLHTVNWTCILYWQITGMHFNQEVLKW